MMRLRTHSNAKFFHWTEYVLWATGICAVAYCAVVHIDAAITQALFAQAFTQARESSIHVTAPDPIRSSEAKISRKTTSLPTIGLLGRLEIPRLGVSTMVVEGATSRTLRVALGHIPGTSRPGQPGNIGIAGHRDTFFRPLSRIKTGDEIVFDTTARNYRYRVSSIEVVEPTNLAVLEFHKTDELTLVTCYPFSYIGPAPKRFIVHASAMQQ